MIACLLVWNGTGDAFARGTPPDAVHHYVFFSRERQGIHTPVFLMTNAFEGAQLTYTWRELEPEPDVYDFSAIRADLAFLTTHHKRLFIQLQDVTFAPAYICIPKYLLQNVRYHGGANQQIHLSQDGKQVIRDGWVARRWDPAVRERFHKLLSALGKAFDGKIEGINLPETAVDLGDSERFWPTGYTPAVYRDAILSTLAALKQAFPRSVTIQYANFMPGESLPEEDRGYLRSVYERAQKLKVGVGGPDMIPYRAYQMKHSYP